MKRPKLVHFTGIQTEEFIHVRASMSYSSHAKFEFLEELNQNLKEIAIVPTRPIQSLGLLSSNEFNLRVSCLDARDEEVTERYYDSDSFGNFQFRVPLPKGRVVKKLKLFETRSHPGLELLIGHFIPTKINEPKKILITDFDKTLVDTRYSTLKELFTSLRNPIQHFPPVENSIKLVTSFLDSGFQPFVVSASPHFYENAIRDWLYQRKIFTGNIFLKDYRNIFSFFEGDLSTKDLKSQGFYKLNTIVNILLMTGIPDELVLVGDGFESDTAIYLTLAAVLLGKYDPWIIWNSVKKEESFRLTNQQHFRFLSKIYQLKNMSDKKPLRSVRIFIRAKKENIDRLRERSFGLEFANDLAPIVEYYIG